ncbi:putative gustatory receptor 28b [Lasioglossum baleicum]|uniref:putative gustatory receptor 28b n=1 Tax=Lasioglossum baleicum TaxID=434251 RepID=UPI003FCD0C34
MVFVRQKIHEAIALLDGSDNRMENMGMSMHRRLHYKQQLKLVAACILIGVVFVIMSFNCQLVQTAPLRLKLSLGCAMNLPTFLILSADVSFLFWVNYVRTKFHQLNNLLRAMLPATDSASEKGISKMIQDVEEKSLGKEGVHVVNGNANTMRAVKQIHLQLVKIARIINDFFGVQLLLTMSTVFVFLTILLFFAYRTIFSGYFNNEFHSHFTQLLINILFYLSKLFTLSHVCNRTSSEASDTGELICQLYEPSTSKEFRAEIRDFSMQMIQNPLVFTACGFFYLDHSFIHGVVGTISTYLVILIQVSQIDLPEQAANVTATVTAI